MEAMNDNQNAFVVVKKYEFNNPNKDDINYIINNSLKNCADKYFHTFTYQCVYNIKFMLKQKLDPDFSLMNLDKEQIDFGYYN